jgi:glycerol-3-phosphate O-acyltransferase / dihydroxyacetone phosphate acyltransferase
VTGWLPALAVATFAAVWLAGLLDLSRRPDLTPWRRIGWAVVMLLLPTLGAAAYLLTRPVPVDRSLVGAPAEPGASVATGPRGARVVQRVASKASRGLFRSVEVLRPADLPATGPQLWFASHFGALSDPIVLLHALDRPPRFLAGDFLWRVPVLRRALAAVRAIPVRRSQDGGGASNRGMFAASIDALGEGDPVAIFPEGVATEGAQVAPLRTGAARIALGAMDAAVTGVALVPVGVHYQDRAALRHRVFVDIGEPLDLDAWYAARSHQPVAGGSPSVHRSSTVLPLAEDRGLVRALTDELERRLRSVAPAFADLDQAHALHAAAEIALASDPAAPPTWGRRAELAADLGRAPAEERGRIVEAVVGYREALAAAGLSDAEVIARGGSPIRRVVATALVGVVLLPFALLGAVLHAPLVLLVRAVRRLRVAPPTLATILPVVGLVGALLTWGLTAWWLGGYGTFVSPDHEGWFPRTIATLQWLLVLPAWGWAALTVSERLASAGHALRARRRRGRSATAAVLQAMREQRAEVVARVTHAAPR